MRPTSHPRATLKPPRSQPPNTPNGNPSGWVWGCEAEVESTDLGKTWTQTPCTPEKPLFGEHALTGEPVKISAPHPG